MNDCGVYVQTTVKTGEIVYNLCTLRVFRKRNDTVVFIYFLWVLNFGVESLWDVF